MPRQQGRAGNRARRRQPDRRGTWRDRQRHGPIASGSEPGSGRGGPGRRRRGETGEASPAGPAASAHAPGSAASQRAPARRSAAEHKRLQVEGRRQQRRLDGLRKRIADLEGRIAEREEAIRKLEAEMAAPGFFTDQTSADAAVKRHQELMWEVGDLMNQWEALEQEAAERALPS